ncbi:MAG: penicillin-binding protein 2 [Holosporales bacterium]|jgi:penicillin-binding protein 2|nr:penicillin-binding protein 2 [Holosporales bacterium]
MHNEKREASSNRTTALCLLIFGVFTVLIFRLFFLQILNQERYRLLSDKNRIYTSFSTPPRGIIYDRNGVAIAVSVFKYQAVIELLQYKASKSSWGQIKDSLHLAADLALQDIINAQIKKVGPSNAVVIKDNLNRDDILHTAILSSYIPGISANKQVTRYYPQAENFCHIIGYVTAPKTEDINNDASLNILGSTIGKAGLEQVKDYKLRGEMGVKQYEINAYRRFVRIIDKQKPSIGRNLHTTIDAQLQAEVRKIMGDVRRGAAIVIDVQNGDILAMVSVPTFDPNIFVQGMTTEQWKQLCAAADNPLINRAISGVYAPGSTFKMVVALAALKSGIIDKNTTFSCPGFCEVGTRRFHCWKWRTVGHGALNICQAIAQSCDVFFYRIAEKLGPHKILEAARELGIGAKTAIPLPAEKSGFLPVASPQWKKQYLGQALNLSIGQGQLLMTPIQMAVMIASLATGKLVVPRLIVSNKGHSDEKQSAKLPFRKDHLQLVQQGMRLAVNSAYGTARRAGGSDVEIAGKTGSTQVVAITKEERIRGKIGERPYHLKDHAMFVGFSPVDTPRFAVVVVVEHGESGGRVAAPLARDIISAAQRVCRYTRPKKGQKAEF